MEEGENKKLIKNFTKSKNYQEEMRDYNSFHTVSLKNIIFVLEISRIF